MSMSMSMDMDGMPLQQGGVSVISSAKFAHKSINAQFKFLLS